MVLVSNGLIMGQKWFNFNFSYSLVVIGAAVFLILGSQAAAALWNYGRLNSQAKASINTWEVVQKSSSSFALKVVYQFEFKENIHQGEMVLAPPYHFNRPSAEKAASNLEKKEWAVWVNSHNPEVSSLEREFPLKKTIYAFIALGITLYFGFLQQSSKIRIQAN